MNASRTMYPAFAGKYRSAVFQRHILTFYGPGPDALTVKVSEFFLVSYQTSFADLNGRIFILCTLFDILEKYSGNYDSV
jgi:hypothetical protein